MNIFLQINGDLSLSFNLCFSFLSLTSVNDQRRFVDQLKQNVKISIESGDLIGAYKDLLRIETVRGENIHSTSIFRLLSGPEVAFNNLVTSSLRTISTLLTSKLNCDWKVITSQLETFTEAIQNLDISVLLSLQGVWPILDVQLQNVSESNLMIMMRM